MQARSSFSYPLASILRNRRWQCCTKPFLHFIARDVFAPDFYGQLEDGYGALMARGLSEQHDPNRFSRNIKNYDAYSMLFSHDLPDPFQVFISREWHDMLAQLADIPATGDVTGGFHHHKKGSKHGKIHNDLNPGWFVDSAYPGDINLSCNDICEYSTGHASGSGYGVHESVRALAVLFYLHNPPWGSNDGGETGLYESYSQPVDSPSKSVPPINNTLFIFECRPNSYHSFISNRANARNSVIMWLHRPKSDVIQRWGNDAIVGWSA
jgi:2OG-Fe(II) oxygenase superfamily